MKEFIKRKVLEYIFLMIYFIGLSLIVPAIVTFKAPSDFRIWKWIPVSLIISSGFFILIGIGGLSLLKGSHKKALKKAGIVTLIPGIIAILSVFKGENFVYNLIPDTLNTTITKNIINNYITSRVPHLITAAFVYLLIGFFLIYRSMKRK